MIRENSWRQTGHSGFILDHSIIQVRQKQWKQPSAKAFSSILPRQIGQCGSGEERFDGDWDDSSADSESNGCDPDADGSSRGGDHA